MTDPVAATLAWLARSDAPNVLVLVAALTSPWKWSRAVHARLSTLLDKALPTTTDER